MGHVLDQVVDNGRDRACALDPGLEGAGHGAHAAGHALGQQPCQEIREPIGVGQARRIAPVRPVGALLDRLSVERAIGKSVEGENVVAARFEEFAECVEGCGFVERFGGGGG